MSLDIAFLGTGSGYPTPHRGASGIALRYDGEVWLIDCGEGTQTQIMKLKLIRPGRITKIFITHLHGDHVFGLPGLLCTISMAYKPNTVNGSEGVDREDHSPNLLEIYGPCGLRRFLRETLSLSRSILAFQYVVHELVPEKKQYQYSGVSEPDWDQWKPDHMATSTPHINESGFGRAIFYDPNVECWPVYTDAKITIQAGQLRHRIPSFGYVFTESPKPGKLESAKLQQAGVPKGPLYGRIKKGETVKLDDGRTINPSDYVGPDQPGRKVAILQDTRDSWGMLKMCQNCDVIIHEATNEDALVKQCVENGHSTPAMAAEFASAAGALRLVLTHFSQRYKDKRLHEEIHDDDCEIELLQKQASQVFSGEVITAFDGLLLPVIRKSR